jgi:hypothetical protein
MTVCTRSSGCLCGISFTPLGTLTRMVGAILRRLTHKNRKAHRGREYRERPPVDVFGQDCSDSPFVYCAGIHLSEPDSLTAKFVMKMCKGLPSAVPRCSVEMSRGPAFS